MYEFDKLYDGSTEPGISFAPDNPRPAKDILDEFLQDHPDSSEYVDVIEALKESDVWNLNSGCWDDNYDILGYLPPCPNCRSKMRFNDTANVLRCPECGYTLDGNDYPYRDMPSWDEISEDDYKM